uniref:Uncharacterized protein n=1 Tax=Magallana gigas TaxID=29159 RepID=K1QUA4_MAGGI
MGFAVTNVEIPALQPTMESTNGECPPDLALAAIEISLTVGRKQLYETCFEHGVNIDGDSVFHTWKKLKSKMKSAQPTVDFLGNIPHVPKLAAKEKSKPSTGSKDGSIFEVINEIRTGEQNWN